MSEIARIDFTSEQVELIKTTIARGATDGELAMFLTQCKRTGLDPFSRQIHAVKRWDSKERREVMSIQVGIDGLRLIADRTDRYAGSDQAVFDSEDYEHPEKATVTVWKLVGGQRVPFTRSARWSEFVQTTKEGLPNRFWQRMPYHMLGKVAEALAIRAAFPQELSGLYTTDEFTEDDPPPAIETRPIQPERQAPPSPAQQLPAPVRTPAPAVATPSTLPENGHQLRERLTMFENRLVTEKLCKPGELVTHVRLAGEAGGAKDWDSWTPALIEVAVSNAKAFEGSCRRIRAARHRKPTPAQREAANAPSVAPGTLERPTLADLIEQARRDCDFTDDGLTELCREHGCENVEDLTAEQVDQVAQSVLLLIRSATAQRASAGV